VVIDLSGPPEVVRPAALEPQSLSA
jgi:hypothetical protein